jgi:hypothetical protein
LTNTYHASDAFRWAEEQENTDLMSACNYSSELALSLQREFSSAEEALRFLVLRFANVESCCKTVQSASEAFDYNCDLVISNTHQQKGYEFPVVIMGNDFQSTQGERSVVSPSKLEDRFNLIYVAMTRARDVLVLNNDLDYLVLQHLRPPVAALRLPSVVGAGCCMCGTERDAAAEAAAGVEVDGGGGASSAGWAASLRRWGLCVSLSRDRHARGHTSVLSDAPIFAPPSGCCGVCLSKALRGPKPPKWAPPAMSPDGLAEFWGPRLLQPSP